MRARDREASRRALIWTRTVDGRYAVGCISGPWRYDDSPAACRVGIHHVRPARWGPRLLSPEEVPVAVVETFARGGRNFQRIRSTLAERQTSAIRRSLPDE